MGAVTPIRRVLVANRGEIAVRIARAARESGIVPLGIYSEADRAAFHLESMEDALCVGPAEASESYLNIARVVAAARELRADAVHPGYGFLSERAVFAQAVRDAGLIFVGPAPEAIAAMGDKTEAKRRTRERGVPVVPGYDGEDQSLATLRAAAEQIGTPLLIKASAGGGGRGMRVVADLAQFGEALESAQREALAAFGDARVLLEKYLLRPRHIEFQIVADAYGRTIHLGERECSIQRRHQKIVEEAPSTALDPALRERMGAAAIRAAESVRYTNAGTVEFLLAEDGAFYFLEMNARLQVEHPVTELVYGLDLVRLQFELASGARLELEQHAVTPRGWAIEARIAAEDPDNGYLPVSGTIERFEPPSGPGIRLDTGVRSGSDVSIYYDSMLAKLIAFGPDRASAVTRLTEALERFTIAGLRTNVPLLLRVARDAEFRAGNTTTDFLNERAAALRADSTGEPDAAVLLAAGAVLADPRAWRIAGGGIPVRLNGRRSVAMTASRGAGDDVWHVHGDLAGTYEFAVAGERVAVLASGERRAGRARLGDGGVDVTYEGHDYRFTFAPSPELGAAGTGAASGGAGAVNAPMPGKVLKVAVAPGDAVNERDVLVVLEAMKMEHRIEAPRSGRVRAVLARAGELVAGGATLVEFET